MWMLTNYKNNTISICKTKETKTKEENIIKDKKEDNQLVIIVTSIA